MTLAYTGETIQNTALASALILLILTVLALACAWRDTKRKSPRCRKCRYPIDVTNRLRCSECGWETQHFNKLYFRRLSRRWLTACLGLLGLAGLSLYMSVVQERITSLNEPYAAAWIPTT